MLELLVVIVLIGVLAAISPPIFSNGVSAAEHRALARSVAQTLRFARSEVEKGNGGRSRPNGGCAAKLPLGIVQ